MKLIPILPSVITLITVLNLAHGQSSSPPTVSVPSSIPLGIVAAPYELAVPTTGAPVTYNVKHLPPGLEMDDGTGIISGIPTRDGTFHVSVRAENDAGKSAKIEFDIEILPLPANLVGTYHGYVFPELAVNGNLGSRLELRTSSSGAATGKIVTGGDVLHFTGSLALTGPDATLATLDVIIPRHDSTPLTFQGVLDIETNGLSGNLMDEAAMAEDPFLGMMAFNGWRNAWSATNPATAFDTYYTFRLETQDFEPTSPQGYGFGSITMTDAESGTVHIVGRTADNKSITTSTFISSQYSEVMVYQPLYQKQGAIGGSLILIPGATVADNTLTGSLFWIKPANPSDRLYPAGFGYDPFFEVPTWLSVGVEGGAYPAPAPGGVVMGLPDDTPNNAQIAFTSGGLDVEGAEFGEFVTISNPGSGLDNEATVPPPNVNQVEIPTLSAALGNFSGDFTMPASPGVAKRKAPFKGQIVRIGDTVAGYGFFLLAEVPEGGETSHTSPKNSGKVVLQAAD